MAIIERVAPHRGWPLREGFHCICMLKGVFTLHLYDFDYHLQAVLYDVILKNREKLIHPRNSNSTSLY